MIKVHEGGKKKTKKKKNKASLIRKKKKEKKNQTKSNQHICAYSNLTYRQSESLNVHGQESNLVSILFDICFVNLLVVMFV